MGISPEIFRDVTPEGLSTQITAYLSTVLNKRIVGIQIDTVKSIPEYEKTIYASLTVDTSGASVITSPYVMKSFTGPSDAAVKILIDEFISANPAYWESEIYVVYRANDADPNTATIGFLFYNTSFSDGQANWGFLASGGSATPVGPAGGDLSGTYPNPIVDGIRNVPVSATAPIAGDVLVFDGAQWIPGAAIPGGAAGGDLAGTYPSPSVAGFAGVPLNVSMAAPLAGDITRFNGISWGAVPLTTAGAASGDLSGTYPSPTVIAWRGVALSAGMAAPTINDYARFDGAAWVNTPFPAGLPPTGAAAGDLAGTYPSPTVGGWLGVGLGGGMAAPVLNDYPRFNGTIWVNTPFPLALPPNGSASGDLSGTYPSPAVIAWRGVALAAGMAAPALNDYARFDGAAWVNTQFPAGLPPTGAAAGDLAGTYPNPTVRQSSTEFALSGVISPAALAANANDYTPAGLSAASFLRLSSSTAVAITGISGGVSGRLLTLHNIGANSISFMSQDGGSLAANRFDLPENFTLAPQATAVLQYDSTTARWRALSYPSTDVVLTGNTLWVDAVNGNDSTANAGRQDLPWLTINAAVIAASNGNIVKVRRGTYTLSAGIAKNGVSVDIDYGTIINYDVIVVSGLGAGETFKITGGASFVCTGVNGTLIGSSAAGSSVVMRFDQHTFTGGVSPAVFSLDSTSITNVFCNSISANCTAAITFGGTWGANSVFILAITRDLTQTNNGSAVALRGAGTIIINAGSIVSVGRCISTLSGTGGTCSITASRIVSSTQDAIGVTNTVTLSVFASSVEAIAAGQTAIACSGAGGVFGIISSEIKGAFAGISASAGSVVISGGAVISSSTNAIGGGIIVSGGVVRISAGSITSSGNGISVTSGTCTAVITDGVVTTSSSGTICSVIVTGGTANVYCSSMSGGRAGAIRCSAGTANCFVNGNVSFIGGNAAVSALGGVINLDCHFIDGSPNRSIRAESNSSSIIRVRAKTITETIQATGGGIVFVSALNITSSALAIDCAAGTISISDANITSSTGIGVSATNAASRVNLNGVGNITGSTAAIYTNTAGAVISGNCGNVIATGGFSAIDVTLGSVNINAVSISSTTDSPLAINGGNAVISCATIAANSATSASGVTVNSGNLDLSCSGTIQGGVASAAGRGLRVVSGTVAIRSRSIRGPTAIEITGGTTTVMSSEIVSSSAEIATYTNGTHRLQSQSASGLNGIVCSGVGGASDLVFINIDSLTSSVGNGLSLSNIAKVYVNINNLQTAGIGINSIMSSASGFIIGSINTIASVGRSVFAQTNGMINLSSTLVYSSANAAIFMSSIASSVALRMRANVIQGNSSASTISVLGGGSLYIDAMLIQNDSIVSNSLAINFDGTALCFIKAGQITAESGISDTSSGDVTIRAEQITGLSSYAVVLNASGKKRISAQVIQSLTGVDEAIDLSMTSGDAIIANAEIRPPAGNSAVSLGGIVASRLRNCTLVTDGVANSIASGAPLSITLLDNASSATTAVAGTVTVNGGTFLISAAIT